jgi:aminodeoxyfutalosine synthase
MVQPLALTPGGVPPDFADLQAKIAAGERLDESDALRLFHCEDLHFLGWMAAKVNLRKNQRRATFIVNRYINYSNYCILNCQFCAFARKQHDADGFEYSVAEIVQMARAARQQGITELHIVGGLHPSLPFAYYTDLLRALKTVDSRLQLKCFTAIEIRHLAWLAKKNIHDTLVELRAAGLDCLTGGGAEIFRPAVRQVIAEGKAPDLASIGWPQHLHHALRTRGIARRPRGSSGATPSIAGRNARLRRFHSPALPAGQ